MYQPTRASTLDDIGRALNPVLVALRPERRRSEMEKRRRGSRLVLWLGAGLGAVLLALAVLHFACTGAPA